MDVQKNLFSVFTKPWKSETADELGEKISKMGFDAIEFPLRDGYQVTPENAITNLKPFADKMAQYNLKITSVASTTDEKIFAACESANIELIRIMFDADLEEGYMLSECKMKKEIEKFLPLCEKYNVKVGVQHHCGAMVSTSMELRHLLEGFDPKYVGAIWDAAHSGLAGEEPEQGLDIVWDYIMLVNLKTAFYRANSGPETSKMTYERYFTTGRYGICEWDRVIKFLHKKNYSGTICLPAEYTNGDFVEAYAEDDLNYIKQLIKENY